MEYLPQKRRRYDGMGLVVGIAQRVSIKDQIFLLLVFQRIRVSINTVNRRALLHTIFEVFLYKDRKQYYEKVSCSTHSAIFMYQSRPKALQPPVFLKICALLWLI